VNPTCGTDISSQYAVDPAATRRLLMRIDHAQLVLSGVQALASVVQVYQTAKKD
jgi:hypothetical protein